MGSEQLPQRWARTFTAEVGSVAEVRNFLLGLLTELPDAVQDTSVLLASELATNALKYGTGAGFEVTLALLGGRGPVRVEVCDSNAESPILLGRDPNSDGGRGLLIVDQLSDRWGWETVLGGKVTWFEVGRSSSPCNEVPDAGRTHQIAPRDSFSESVEG